MTQNFTTESRIMDVKGTQIKFYWEWSLSQDFPIIGRLSQNGSIIGGGQISKIFNISSALGVKNFKAP